MAKKKRGRFHRAKSFMNMRSIFGVIKLGSFVAPAITEYEAMSGSIPRKIGRVIAQYGGYNLENGSFEVGLLGKMWGPYIATNLITVGVQKLNGIIRRL